MSPELELAKVWDDALGVAMETWDFVLSRLPEAARPGDA